ncbi:hypothetical protein [Proteus phage 2207-N35]|nr:hypothetical protein [Proteus phage 2207-N35]
MFKVGDKVIANGKKGTIISTSGDFVSVLYSSNTGDITHKNNVSHDFQLDEWVDLMGEKYEKHVSNLVKLRDCKTVITPVNLKPGDKVIRTNVDVFWNTSCNESGICNSEPLIIKHVDTYGNLIFDELKGSYISEYFELVKPKDTIIMRNIIKYQVFDTQLNKVVNTFDTLKDAEDTLYRLNKSAINIGEEFENGNIAVKVENVDLVSEEVEVVIHHCGQPFYSSYDLGKFLREFKKCVQ